MSDAENSALKGEAVMLNICLPAWQIRVLGVICLTLGAMALNPSAAHADGNWSVGLTASQDTVWPTQGSTLTATASDNVSYDQPITIYDITLNQPVAVCDSGAACSAYVTYASVTTHQYVAYVGDRPGAGNPPANAVATSNWITVTWQSVRISLNVYWPSTMPIGGSVTIAARSDKDIGPSPFWIEIFDATTGTLVGRCGYGTSCTATVTQVVPTSHEYQAYVSDITAAYPPTSIQAHSDLSFATWSDGGRWVFLAPPTPTGGADNQQRIKAYYDGFPLGDNHIRIWDMTHGQDVADCSDGDVGVTEQNASYCTGTFIPAGGTSDDLVAFIAPSSPFSFPPANPIASSNNQFYNLGF